MFSLGLSIIISLLQFQFVFLQVVASVLAFGGGLGGYTVLVVKWPLLAIAILLSYKLTFAAERPPQFVVANGRNF